MIPTTRFAVALMLSLSVGGCSASNGDGAPLDLEEARAVWENRSIDDYGMTFQQICFCPPGLRQPLDVQVVDGQVKNVTGLEQPVEYPELLDAGRLTIEGLFRFIENTKLRDRGKLRVEYNQEYGFPALIEYEGDPRIADDQLQYRITDFQPR
ncbi:DUF6174 domain-containing protein [Marinobacter sp.]|uniref:DUF6174 domain-containing protein n=1 Tax=Marinobacter sp. TaxID=50741 RepID=UPI00384D60B7